MPIIRDPHCQPQEGAEEPETNPSVPQKEEQRDAREGKVTAVYDPNADYEPETSDPDNGGEENSDAKYAEMKLP